jgi:transposase-like protein
MNLHSGARSCPASRALLIERIQRGTAVTAAAAAVGISRRSAYKWIARHRRDGTPGLQDRSSRPRRSPTALPLESIGCILLLRHSRLTMAQIAACLAMPRSTVARVLKRHGLNQLRAPGADQPARRYTRRHPGELVHLDVKKLGRISGFYGHCQRTLRSRPLRTLKSGPPRRAGRGAGGAVRGPHAAGTGWGSGARAAAMARSRSR